METWSSILTAILTSAVVSTALGAVLEGRSKRRLQDLSHRQGLETVRLEQELRHQYEIQLVKLQHAQEERMTLLAQELGRHYQVLAHSEGVREEVLSQFAKYVYKLRNAARDVFQALTESEDVTSAIEETLRQSVTALEDGLYERRLFLETEQLFGSLHAFKNRARFFLALIRDRKDLTQRGALEGAREMLATIQTTYGELDFQYQHLMKLFQNPISVPPAVSPIADA